MKNLLTLSLILLFGCKEKKETRWVYPKIDNYESLHKSGIDSVKLQDTLMIVFHMPDTFLISQKISIDTPNFEPLEGGDIKKADSIDNDIQQDEK